MIIQTLGQKDLGDPSKRVLDPATRAAENAEHLYNLKGAAAFQQGRTSAEAVGVRALDEFTLRVELEEPVGHFLHLLAYSVTLGLTLIQQRKR